MKYKHKTQPFLPHHHRSSVIPLIYYISIYLKNITIMKKFTILSAALAAMMWLPAFADGTDVTEKLVNPNGDKELLGWKVQYNRTDVTSGFDWLTSGHTENENPNQYGYWGWVKPNFEIWNSSQIVVDENNISQTVRNLPNGTYVFSAFCVAVRTGSDYANPDDWKECYGGYMFANDDSVSVATNPTGTIVDGQTWLHARRFHVATTVTDGTLKVGVGAKTETNLYWIGFDGVKLYDFGNVTTDEALLGMAKIELAEDVAVADTLKAYPMTADGAKGLADALPFAEGAQTIEDIAAAEDTIRIACAFARNGIAAVSAIAEQLVVAKEVVEGDWSDMVAQQVVNLKKKIAQVEADLAANALTIEEVEAYKTDFLETIDQVRIDALWDAYDALSVFLDSPEEISEDYPVFGLTAHPGFGSEAGQYPLAQEESLRSLLEQVATLLSDIEQQSVPASTGFAYVATIENAVKACVAAANKDTVTLPYHWILIPDPNDPTQPYTANGGFTDPYFSTFFVPVMLSGVEEQVMQFVSPVIKLDAPIQELTISLGWSPRGGDILIDEFYIFDLDGNRIQIPYEQISFNWGGWYSNDGSWRGLIDDTPNEIFWQSGWGTGSDGYQTITFTLSEPIDAFYLAYENLANDWRWQCTAFDIYVGGRSHVDADLQMAIDEANALGGLYVGSDPGFYTTVPAGLDEALTEAQQLLAEGGTDAEKIAATESLLAVVDVLSALTPVAIEEGVEYMLTNAFPGFHETSGCRKAMTVLQDSILWWDSADPADKYQRWVFEKTDASDLGEGYSCYNVKNVATGKYLSEFVRTGEAWEPTGEPITWGNPAYVKLGEAPCRWDVFGLGYGQWGIRAEIGDGAWYQCHTCNHNSGVPTETFVAPGGNSDVHPDGYSLAGVCGPIVQWDGAAGSASAWYIWSDVETLPLTAATAGKMLHFATATSVYSLTADVNCAFEGLTFTDLTGTVLTCNMKQTTNSVIVQFDKAVADFAFTFNGSEDVTVTVDASTFEKTKYELLQEAYAAVKNEFTEGTNVGNMKSLKDYNAAIAAAEQLLENGGTDDELVAAAEALFAAYDALEMVLPDEGKTYIIRTVLGEDEYFYGMQLGVYNHVGSHQLGYAFLDEQNPAFQWQFVAMPELGARHYLLRSVADGMNVGYAWAFEQVVPMTTDTCTYEIINNGTLNSISFHADHSKDINFSLHNPRRASFGGMLYWGPTAGGSRFFVSEVTDEDTRVYDLEELAEPCAPVRRGVHDLTGRRVLMPERGLYIEDGKKKIVK